MDTTWSALIIDDAPGVRQSMRLCLEVDEARVMTVGTSAGALEALERSWFDVVDVAPSPTGHGGLDIGQAYDQDTGRNRSNRRAATGEAAPVHGRGETPAGSGSLGAGFQRQLGGAAQLPFVEPVVSLAAADGTGRAREPGRG